MSEQMIVDVLRDGDDGPLGYGADGTVRGLVADVIYDAIRLAEKTPPFYRDGERRKRDAVVWLGSTAATWWFDYLGISQSRALRHLGWDERAEEVLRSDVEIDWSERRILEAGIARIRTYRRGPRERAG